MSIDVGFMGKSPCPLMYWIDMERDTLYFRLDDPVVNLLPNIQNATTLALDGFEYYWTEKTDNNTWRIRRAVGQSGPWEVPYAEFTDTPMGIAIADRELYVSVASGKILRIPTNVGCYFAEPNFDFITGLASPEHLIVDVFGKNLYWTEKDSIWRASLNGENVERVVTGLGMPAHLVLDARLP